MCSFSLALRKLELFVKLEAFLCCHFLKCSMNKKVATGSFFIMVSCVIRGYHYYNKVWSPNDDSLKGNAALLARCDTVVRYYLLACTPITQYPGTIAKN